ncbi:hypothetical protein EB796_024939 [Bugula neritina]|uniref:Uncharacterized protein n=1 Tax=Bugula neritina TaxID=10212 RepID=A0A7J7ITM2_BUGNE|nr:hypothetical protein EB796_024939 [Bugula neritina]
MTPFKYFLLVTNNLYYIIRQRIVKYHKRDNFLMSQYYQNPKVLNVQLFTSLLERVCMAPTLEVYMLVSFTIHKHAATMTTMATMAGTKSLTDCVSVLLLKNTDHHTSQLIPTHTNSYQLTPTHTTVTLCTDNQARDEQM